MSKPVVIILHGIYRTQFSMSLYEIYLRLKGYNVVNITYPSLRYNLEQLSEKVGGKLLKSQKISNAADIHFVTHSMGGLITRYILAEYPELRARTRNIVMLVPPNRGSEAADYAYETGWMKPLYRFFYGPAGQQLTTSYASNYPALEGNVGIIAGTRSNNPLAKMIFEAGQKHDGTISHANMKLSDADQVLDVHASHTSILCSREALRQTLHFIQTGSFAQQAQRATP